MAKENISDIIDLTCHNEDAEDDDEKERRPGARLSSVYGGPQGPRPTPINSNQHQSRKGRQVATSTSISTPVSFANGAPVEAGKGDAGSGFSSFRASAEIVQPIVARGDARASYDPQTIAHNILVATGRYPGKPGLNAHLQVLKKRFDKVDDQSDLSTFRWDLIDPEIPVFTGGATSLGKGRLASTPAPTVPTNSVEKGSKGERNTGIAVPTKSLQDVPRPSLPYTQHSSASKSYETSNVDSGDTSVIEIITHKKLPGGGTRGGIRDPSLGSVMLPTFGQPGIRSQEIPIHKSPQPTRGGLSARGRGSYIPSLPTPTRGAFTSKGGSTHRPNFQTSARGGLSSREYTYPQPSLVRNSSNSDVTSSGFSVVVDSPSPPKTQYRPQPGGHLSEYTSSAQQKLRYIPGGPGGGGRYVYDESNGTELPVGRIDNAPNHIRPTSETFGTATTPQRGRPPKSTYGATGIPPSGFYTSPKKRDSLFSAQIEPQRVSGTPSDILSSKKKGRPPRTAQDADSKVRPLKKRGRPYKTAEAAAAAAARADLDPSDLTRKRKPGRPPKDPSDLIFLPPPDPVFHPFECEWEGCPAELHNLETLRNHVLNVHGAKPSSGRYTCLWKGCGPTREAVNGTIKTHEIAASNVEFKTRQEFQTHFENVHIVTLAWHMGDGPKSTSLATPEQPSLRISSPWLFDNKGKQVTPSVEDIPIEYGHPKPNNANRFIKKRDGLYIVTVPIEEPSVEARKHSSNGDQSTSSRGVFPE